MTEQVDTTAIGARLAAATSGPWEVDDTGWGVVNSEQRIGSFGKSRDAEFIAHAPSDIDALLAENERLRYLGFDVSPAGRPRNNRDGACTCNYNPTTTSGPEEDCPFHGRAYADWVARAEAAEAALERARKALSKYASGHRGAIATLGDIEAALDGAHPTPSDGSGQ